VEEFRRDTEAFIARHRQPDGSVRVDPGAAAPPGSPASDHGGHDAHGAGHDMPAVAAAPPEIHLLVQQWSFEPDVLRLRVDVPYRLRMMAVDVAHGASLYLGSGSRIVRLRQGVLVEQDVTFRRPGEYLLYCTLYCGIGHDRMTGRIIVT
jgi:heme/copper-type cytochrome/quinol oxidase subunit 2